MSGSDNRSYSSGDGSSKSCIDGGAQLVFVSPVSQKVARVFRPKSDSPRSVFFEIDDLDNSKSSGCDNPDIIATLVSPRRSHTNSGSRSKSGPSTPYRQSVKLQIVHHSGDPSEASSSKHIRPPSGRSTRDSRSSRSPRKPDRDEDTRSRRSSSHRSSSRTRRHDHRSKSRTRRHSKEKDEYSSDKRRSSSRPHSDYHRHHSSSSSRRDRTSDGHSRRDHHGYESSRPRSRERSSDYRSHRDRQRYESTRTSSRDRNSESRSYGDRHQYDRSRTQSRDKASESPSSTSRRHPESSRDRSKSRSRKEVSSSRRRTSTGRPHSRERRSSPSYRRDYTSSRSPRSPSRNERSSRSSRRTSTNDGNESSRGMRSEYDKQGILRSPFSPLSSVSSKGRVQRISNSFPKLPFERSNLEDSCTEMTVQEKTQASVVLQSAWRCYLAVTKYQKTVSQRNEEILETKNLEKKRRLEEESKQTEQLLRDVEDKRIADIKMLKESIRAEKRALKEKARRKFEKHVQKMTETWKAEQEALDALNRLEMSELTDEAEKLKESLVDLESKMHEVEEENSQLQKANNDVGELFDSLNEFARRKTESKKKLVTAAQKLVEVYKPKIKAELVQSVLSCKVETKLKDYNRSYIYKIAHTVLTSDAYDHELYEGVMKTIHECESFLGNTVLSPNQAIDDMPIVESNVADVKDKNSSSSGWNSDTSTEMNQSCSWGVSSAWGEGSAWNLGRSMTENQLCDSRVWEVGESPGSNWENFEDGWASGRNLEDMLDKAFQLNDIDCQSHNSWRTEHEDLMSCIR